jgi:phthalate 4,5-cis-dihydrodiol dehydrogenase
MEIAAERGEQVTERKLRIGVAGLGRAFSLMVPTFTGDSRVQLVAAATQREEARQKFAREFSGHAYATVAELCADPAVEIVYIATPHQLHAEHACLAAANGKHLLIEKPMALSIDECRRMISAARKSGVQLIVGHSHSFNAPILKARALIAGGKFGKVRMIQTLNFTDFLYRPRRPEELRTEEGGGVIFSQAAHQVDIVRLLGGGMVKSVRAQTGAWDPGRPTEGAYSALLTFENGVFATLTYSGYAHFDSDEFTGWIGELGKAKDQSRYGAARKALKSAGDASEEAALKSTRNYGGANYSAAGVPAPGPDPIFYQHFGFTLVSCDRADLRPLPTGVMIYGDTEQRLDALPEPAVPRSEVIDELYNAVVLGRAPVHSGEWSLATMEVCFAILTSAREQREVTLEHQVAAA